MGLYLEDDNKKMWLDRNGTQLTDGSLGHSNIDYRATTEDEILVCCVDNGIFYEASVPCSEAEILVCCVDNPDGRPKYWYSVKKQLAKPKSPMWNSFIKD